MEHTKLSENFQVTLPDNLIRQLNLKAGQEFICVVKNGAINLIPRLEIQSLRGLLKGANPENYRERSSPS